MKFSMLKRIVELASITNISFDIFLSKWHRNAFIANTIFGTPINAFRYHFDWKMSKQIKDVSFLTMAYNSAHKGTHKIQLLTYSCNVERAVEVKLSLKSKRKSEKRIELDKRNLMHVIILLNTINCGKPGGRETVVELEFSLVAISINAFMNDNEWM